MDKTRPLRPLLAALALATLSPAAFAGSGDAAALAAADLPTDRLIVKYRSDASASLVARAKEAATRRGMRLELLRRGGLGTHVMRIERRLPLADVRQLAREIAETDANVEYAEPDRILQALATPNDTQYGQQWHYYEARGGLNLPLAWDLSTGSGVRVAVIDTGYRPHADLAANVVGGYDFIKDTANSNDSNARDSDAKDPGDYASYGQCGLFTPSHGSSWHGTHVAGTIAAVTNNGSGVAGVAYGAKVVPVRVLGACGGYTSDIADGIIWASGGSVSGVPANTNPARVINMSLGGSGSCDSTSQNAINSARSRGTVVVVAAGNSNANASGFSPAGCSGVITVAATNRNGGRASYSNYGAVVAVAAPGGETSSGSANGILSTLNSGTRTPGSDSYAYYQGTSMASPHVAGVVALMLARNPSLTPDQVASILKSTARAFPASCSQCGSGIVDAHAAVAAAGGGTTPPPTNTVAEAESNNTIGTAQLVREGYTVNGTISSIFDTDYFRVDIGPGSSLGVTLTPPSGANYNVYIYNSAGTALASSTLGTGQVDSTSVQNTGSTVAAYYVRVRYASGTNGASGNYTLAID